MKEKHIVRYKKGMKDQTDWARVRAMRNEDIDFSDNPELDEKFWATAKLIVAPKSKKLSGVRIDSDIVNWFKLQGTGYQNKINAVLKTYIKAKTFRKAS